MKQVGDLRLADSIPDQPVHNAYPLERDDQPKRKKRRQNAEGTEPIKSCVP
jgi:hypothetical protein